MPAVSSSAAEAPVRAAVVGIAGLELTEAERRLFQARPPWGFILFARNCRTPAQVRRLVEALRAAAGNQRAPVLIDQEGGRVARLRPPHWPARPAARRIGALAERDPDAGREAAWLHGRLLAADLAPLGVTVDCAPVLDLALPGQTSAIGDRALAADPALVAMLGQAMIEGLLAGGVLPVIKHAPGHGRARVDSHRALPEVDADVATLRANDWRPFVACSAAPFAMTAHVRFRALDADRPATLSARVIREVIRGELGIEGALLSDDLSMGALSGSLGERTGAARAAGCDLALHCNGRYAELVEVLDAAGPLDGAAAGRAERALGHLGPPEPFDAAAGQARFDGLLAPLALPAEPGV